ncbi:hypothetical protein [Streptomyces sp. NPDC048442]|uniref:hypothetical protein n=1 Tax=Streptomyces sp. NPDC048442 TaxID=3154823 RepID=UPI003438952E
MSARTTSDPRGALCLPAHQLGGCRWRQNGLVAEFHDRLRGRVREREGREAEPTAGVIDAQSVKAAATVPAA